MTGAQRLKIGIGGWEHDILNEVFYPSPGLSAEEKLRWYARFFDATEVRSTFWDDSLTDDDASRWTDAVAENPGFIFSVKLHSSFTHRKTIRPQLVRQTRAILQRIAATDHLGSLLLQFPYGFTNTSANRFHIVRLAELFRGFPLHVELRHESWNFPGLLRFLSETGAAPVSGDLPRIRQLMPFFAGTSGDTAYIRLHGRNERGWLLNGLDTRYDYLYNARELKEIRRRIETVSPSCRRVFVLFNTTTGGKGAANALQLLSMTRDGRTVPVPRNLLRTFPVLQQIALDPSEEHLPFTHLRAAM
ncbi:MAG: hypothetical protein C3F17_13480 [Bradyrhizobiaceae bacterium]|nr:MAG: hypothetical protein C3F17_13480 [Bradyrhizobiaceae bacterium]